MSVEEKLTEMLTEQLESSHIASIIDRTFLDYYSHKMTFDISTISKEIVFGKVSVVISVTDDIMNLYLVDTDDEAFYATIVVSDGNSGYYFGEHYSEYVDMLYKIEKGELDGDAKQVRESPKFVLMATDLDEDNIDDLLAENKRDKLKDKVKEISLTREDTNSSVINFNEYIK